MKNWKHLMALPVYIVMASVISACGSGSSALLNSAGSSGGSNGSGGITLISPSPSPSPTNASSALSYEIMNTGIDKSDCTDCLTGQGGKYPIWSTYKQSGNYIDTDDIFQVQVTVASGGELSATGTAASGSSYSNFDATYDCASFQVSVYDDNGNFYGSQTTGMLVVSGSVGCLDEYNGGASDELLDFSGYLSQGGHGSLNVEVQALDYDFYCKLLADYWGSLEAAQYYAGTYYDLWCPSKTVYKTHTISAQIQVNINGTTLE